MNGYAGLRLFCSLEWCSYLGLVAGVDNGSKYEFIGDRRLLSDAESSLLMYCID